MADVVDFNKQQAQNQPDKKNKEVSCSNEHAATHRNLAIESTNLCSHQNGGGVARYVSRGDKKWATKIHFAT